MTAETLKPFITPANVDYVTASHSSSSSVHGRGNRFLIAITASAFVVVLTTTLLGITIWNTVRISNLQTEVENLNKVIESMQKRLGLTYLDDLNDLNNNDLIEDILPDEDDDDDDDDDDIDIDSENISGDDDDDDNDDDDDDIDDDDEDDEEEDDDEDMFDKMIQKFRHFEYEDEDDEDDDDDDNDNINEGALEEDDLFNDFEKYVDSKKKREQGDRKRRSVSGVHDHMDGTQRQLNSSPVLRSSNHKAIVASEPVERRRSPMRLHSSRRRKFPMVKSAKTVAQNLAFNEIEASKPAVHFHLTHKIPYHHSAVQVHTYNGDMYIGKPSWTNERDSFDSYFHVENGVLTVHQSGLYYVYAQVCYNNHYPQNGFIIFHGHKPFLQCLSNIFTNHTDVINTCHTSGLVYLKRDEHIHLRDFHTARRAHLEETNNRSYFGLIKI